MPRIQLQDALKAHKRDHVSPLLGTLRRLLNQARIAHTFLTLCHSFVSNTAPVHLPNLLRVYCPSRQLRSSSDSRTLRILYLTTKLFGHRSFCYAVPSVLNFLPRETRHTQSTTAFKTALQTHLFYQLNVYYLHSVGGDMCVCVCVCVCVNYFS